MTLLSLGLLIFILFIGETALAFTTCNESNLRCFFFKKGTNRRRTGRKKLWGSKLISETIPSTNTLIQSSLSISFGDTFENSEKKSTNYLSKDEEDPQIGLSAWSTEQLVLPGDPTKVRYRCRVTYDGTGFSGFQLQANDKQEQEQRTASDKKIRQSKSKRTVQGVLENSFLTIFQRPIRVVGAGRTDAGVHARGQAIHFDLTIQEHHKIHHRRNEANENRLGLEVSLNSLLPDDIRIWNLGPAPPPAREFVNGDYTRQYAWNAMRKSTSKYYSYRFCHCLNEDGNRKVALDPIRSRDRWQIETHWTHSNSIKSDAACLDEIYIDNKTNETDHSQNGVLALAEILREYEGTHDFACFAGALEANARKNFDGVIPSTVRTIYKCALVCEDEDLGHYRIDIFLDGALYKMVRNIVGTAFDVWRDNHHLDRPTFGKLLHEPSKCGLMRKDNPSKPAPAHGLTMEYVFYSNYSHKIEEQRVDGTMIDF